MSEVTDSLAEGRRLLRDGQLGEAMTLLEGAVTAQPLSVEANEAFATACFLGKDFARAAKHFEQAAKSDSRRAEPLINLGAVQNRMKNHAAAVKTLQKALGRDRKNPDAYYNLGIACRGANQLSMAVNAYKEAIRLRSDFAEAHSNLANVYLDMGNQRQAIASFKRALEISPTLERAQRGLRKANDVVGDDSINPMGRLTEARPKDAAPATPRVALSEADRARDRVILTDLSGRIERTLISMSVTLRQEIESQCQQTLRAITDTDGSARARATHTAMKTTLEDADRLRVLLSESLQELAKHEQAIGKLVG